MYSCKIFDVFVSARRMSAKKCMRYVMRIFEAKAIYTIFTAYTICNTYDKSEIEIYVVCLGYVFTCVVCICNICRVRVRVCIVYIWCTRNVYKCRTVNICTAVFTCMYTHTYISTRVYIHVDAILHCTTFADKRLRNRLGYIYQIGTMCIHIYIYEDMLYIHTCWYNNVNMCIYTYVLHGPDHRVCQIGYRKDGDLIETCLFFDCVLRFFL